MRAAKKLCPKPKKPVAMKSGGQAAKKVKKVVKGFKKASKLHAKQANTLSSLKLREGGSTTKKKSKIKTPKGTKGFKGIQPLKRTTMRANRYDSGGKMPVPISPRQMAKKKLKENYDLTSMFIRDDEALKKKQARQKTLLGKLFGSGPSKDIEGRIFAKKEAVNMLKKESPKLVKRVTKKSSGGKTTKKKSKSTVNKAGNYTKPTMRKRLFNQIKAGGKGGAPGQWSARKAQMLAQRYKKAGGGYRN